MFKHEIKNILIKFVVDEEIHDPSALAIVLVTLIDSQLRDLKVFPSTNCLYRGVKETCFRKSVRVFTGEFSAFTIKSLQRYSRTSLARTPLGP